MTEPDIVETTDPEEAFTALADETRVAILQALWDPGKQWGTGPTKSFSELREAVGMRDSGQFNYHLDKLRGRFVRKTDEGYKLTLAGRHVVGAIRAGSFTMEGSIEPIPLDHDCPSCGGDMVFRYLDEQVVIACEDCDLQLTSGVPPGVFEGVDREDFPTVATRYIRTMLDRARGGFCWYCEGQMERDLVPVRDLVPPEADDPGLEKDIPIARYMCTRCGANLTNDLGTSLLDEPRVAAFFEEHGVDVRGPDWWHQNLLDPDRVSFIDEDASRAAVTYTIDGDALRLEVNDDLQVLDVEADPD